MKYFMVAKSSEYILFQALNQAEAEKDRSLFVNKVNM